MSIRGICTWRFASTYAPVRINLAAFLVSRRRKQPAQKPRVAAATVAVSAARCEAADESVAGWRLGAPLVLFSQFPLYLRRKCFRDVELPSHFVGSFVCPGGRHKQERRIAGVYGNPWWQGEHNFSKPVGVQTIVKTRAPLKGILFKEQPKILDLFKPVHGKRGGRSPEINADEIIFEPRSIQFCWLQFHPVEILQPRDRSNSTGRYFN